MTEATPMQKEVSGAEVIDQGDGTVLLHAPNSSAEDITVDGTALREAAEEHPGGIEGETTSITDDITYTNVPFLFGVANVVGQDADEEGRGIAFTPNLLAEALDEMGF